MKVTIITVCFNAEQTIASTIESVLSQDYNDIEYIVMDGMSNDNTMRIVSNYESRIHMVVSAYDMGMYDAINKGIKMATGDIVGILNADDRFAENDIIEKIAQHFKQNPTTDCVIGDIAFVDEKNPEKFLRYYSSEKFKPSKFVWGFMPAHPSFYCKKEYFSRLGGYRTDFEIGADYELLIRFLKTNSLSFSYLPMLMVKMNLGGKSTQNFRSTIKINQEILKACQINGLYTNYLMLYSKYIKKVFEFLPNKK